MKSVTVIIPTYNRWPTICSAIDSVLEQTYQQTYCIVVDDASTDNTATLLKQTYGDRIEIIEGTCNKGQSACRNIGVEHCKNDCVCFLDSDDILYPRAVESRVSLLNENPNDVLASFGFIRSNTNPHSMLQKKKRGDTLLLSEYLQDTNLCRNNSFLIDKDLFLKSGMYNTELRNKEDIELLIRLLLQHPFSYCGEEIGQVRKVDGEKRVRNNYEQIVNQRNLFSDIIAQSPQLNGHISPSELNCLICHDVEEMLRALYKSHKYVDFRLFYKKAIQDGYILNKKRFRKRYFLSYVKKPSK